MDHAAVAIFTRTVSPERTGPVGSGMVLANFEAVGAAIDALVPPVPAAAPHDEANAKSPYPLKVTAWGWANDRPMPECCEFLHLPDTENCRRCGKALCPAPPENEKEARS
jgi:hypothetical protein